VFLFVKMLQLCGIAANGKLASQESMRRHSVPQGYLYSIQGYSEGLF